jgi:radical SAM protein with 4Fe4S-binding SPASM domain
LALLEKITIGLGMDLIIKPTEKCNFKCTFCSSTHITEDKTAELDLQYVYDFLKRFPETNTIIVNGGDPLMMDPQYYWDIIKHLDEINSHASISFTSNLWPFYKTPNKWKELFNHPRMGITTSFQYGGGRLKGDLSEFTEEDFWKTSNAMLEHCGYRPDFISVITEENEHLAIKNVELAKTMGVECKLNYAFSSGPPVKFKGIIMGQEGKPYMLSDIYEIYVEIWKLGLSDWEFNTKQMMKRLVGNPTCCPQNRDCDSGIRTLQPSGDYYSCGAFGDDREYSINFKEEMNGPKIFPIKNIVELQTMTDDCYTCPMFEICNGCKKTIRDHKMYNITDKHCKKMKTLATDILKANGLYEK